MNDESNIRLRFCPFCGDRASLTEIDDAHSPVRWRVECDDDRDCGAQGPIRDTRFDALIAWNHLPLKVGY